MNDIHSGALAKIMAFSAIAEFATGLALIASPAMVIKILLATEVSSPVGRVAGIALVALGLACWPGKDGVSNAALRGLLTYNLLVAAYLAFLGLGEHLGGPLLWPAVALHAAVAGALLFYRKAAAPAQ
jgi:hypothetical protein